MKPISFVPMTLNVLYHLNVLLVLKQIKYAAHANKIIICNWLIKIVLKFVLMGHLKIKQEQCLNVHIAKVLVQNVWMI